MGRWSLPQKSSTPVSARLSSRDSGVAQALRQVATPLTASFEVLLLLALARIIREHGSRIMRE